MPMLAFLPWLCLDSPVRVGPFHAFPQGIGDALPDGVASSLSPDSVQKVLRQHHADVNRPLAALTILQYDGRPVGDDFSEDERAAIFRFGQHLAVAGMSERRFTGGFSDRYTATGHYQVIVQSFAEPYKGGANLTFRRKDGQANVMMGQTNLQFVRPAHLVTQGEQTINLSLLNALQGIETLPQAIQEHVDASVSQFLLSNSDSPDVPPDVEAAASYSALERLIDDHDIGKVRPGLLELLSAADATPYAQLLRGKLPAFAVDRPTFAKWVGQLYNVRGRLAHGKSAAGYKSDWSQFEHLVAAAFVYPLTLKGLLAKHQLYTLTDDDVAYVLGLEGLLGARPFFDSVDAPSAAALGLDAESVAAMQVSRWQAQFEAIKSAMATVEIRKLLTRGFDQAEGR
jgi:hypothetical protein